ncbi:MAG TPA: hypothetical protein VGG06_17110 [Thermoanaerobaculia bacterium]|jgi:hypothetical protein
MLLPAPIRRLSVTLCTLAAGLSGTTAPLAAVELPELRPGQSAREE